MSNSPQAYAQQIIDGCNAAELLMIRLAREATLREFVVERCPECVSDNCLDDTIRETRKQASTKGM